MDRREHRDPLSFKDFCLSLDGQLSGDNRWIKLAEWIPWDDLSALIIKTRLRLTDEETVEQIKENLFLQFFIGREGFQVFSPI